MTAELEESRPWIHYDEAMRMVREIQDPATRQLAMRALTVVVMKFSEGEYPDSTLDLTYLVETIIELGSQREALLRILNGEDLTWFGDE